MASTSSGDADGGGDAGSIVVGSANFPENQLLAEIYAGALEKSGVTVTKKLNIGSRETYIPALQDGSIDLIPEYTGVLLSYFDQQATATSSDDVYAALPGVLPASLIVLKMSTAEDKDAVVVTKATAAKNKLTTIADLAPVAGTMVLGGPPEWATRSTGVPGLEKVYGLKFKEFKALDTAGPLSVNALKNGQVDAVNLFTTQSAITENDFVVLEDPKSLFAAQNVVPLINKEKATDEVKKALDAVSAKLDTDTLRDLVAKVEVEKADAADVAAEFLKTIGG
jgi:osmoprotectant transport system substrate-binding protein